VYLKRDNVTEFLTIQGFPLSKCTPLRIATSKRCCPSDGFGTCHQAAFETTADSIGVIIVNSG
jgi:hypothetical protein